MSYVIDSPVLWPVPPDWENGVRERLEWLSDVLTARNGSSQKRELRQAPRRFFEFEVVSEGQQRRVLDMLLNDHGSKYWMLPIWHDVQWIQPVEKGAVLIPCQDTTGSDLLPESYAVLWLGVSEWELVMIETVEVDHVIISLPTTRIWPAGTRLYPVRTAHLVEQPQEAAWSDRVGMRTVQMQLDEPNDYPAAWPSTAEYRGLPVLEWRPDESDNRTSAFERTVGVIDADTGPIRRFDRPGRAFRSTEMAWVIKGRIEHARLRSFLYALRGRMGNLWLPSWNTDLVLAAPVAPASSVISIEWAGYTLFGHQQPTRRDIRLELHDGSVFYRRITGSVEDGETETLTLDSAFGRAVAFSDVRQISFMQVCEQLSDRVELLHETDAIGITLCTSRFRAIRYDV